MIKKVLIAEDIDSINTGIITIVNEKFNFVIEHANSCDQAYLKFKKAIQDQNPYDLVISDMSFKTDGFLTPKLKNGAELIKALKEIKQSIKTIVYTIEDKPSFLNKLKEELGVNGVVLKGTKSLNELCHAIEQISNNTDYFSPEVLQLIKANSTVKIEAYDIILLDMLANGFTQQDISKRFKEEAIKPSSVSAIEKRIGDLKNAFKANNSIHLVSIAKDMCII